LVRFRSERLWQIFRGCKGRWKSKSRK